MVTSSASSQIRLIATDLDGTLLGSDHLISERTFEVLAKAQAAGIIVVAATGRGPSALPRFEPAGIIKMAVCSNGAAVVDLRSGDVVERSDLKGTSVATIFAEVGASIPGSCFAWEATSGFGWDPAFASRGQILLDSYGTSGSVDFDEAAPVSKAFVAHEALGYEALARRVREVISIDAEVSCAGLPFVVITAAGVTKANALQRLCDHKGIDASQVVAFGDSWNDLDMLTWAGLGVAMANANDDVKDAADALAGSHNDEGVANFLADLLNL